MLFGETDEEREEAFEITFKDFKDIPQKTPIASKREKKADLGSNYCRNESLARIQIPLWCIWRSTLKSIQRCQPELTMSKVLELKFLPIQMLQQMVGGRLIIDPNCAFRRQS